MPLKSKSSAARKPTATNRSRAPMTAYYRGRDASGSASPFRRREPEPRWRQYAYGAADVFLVIILISGLIYSLIISPNPTVRADDFTFHTLTDYKSAAGGQLASFSNRNKITFNEPGFETALKKRFPEINSVQVELPLFSERPLVNLSIDRASLFLDSQGTRYVIDASGRAVTKAMDLPNVKNLPVINDNSGYKASSGRQVISSDGVVFIDTLIAQCRASGIQIASMTLPAVPQELDLKAKGQSYFVKFFLGGDIMTQAGQYLAARHHFNETNQQPSAYLDVRVPGKVFYK